ncbi:MAG: hypothetical protein VX944_14065 [Myxococcota bacterium]|nr:hypothetical protein [Myxococcota bacterium]
MTRTMLFFSALLTASACTSNDSSDGPTVGSSSSPDTGTAIIDDPDTGVPTDTGATTGAPDWVDPEVPEGPIAPPDGSGTDPEDSDFDWTGIGAATLADTFPGEHLTWNAYPQYGTAQILDWSDSDACVCFNADCTTCSAEDCSTEACTYDLNDNHTLTKYHVEMRSTEYTDHALSFEVNISADPPLALGINDALARLERIPVEYWYGLKVITEFGHGIQFLHASYFAGGAAAYGGMNYIDTRTVDLPVLLHELGHTFEQYTRIGNPPALEAQANILNPVWRNAIRADDNRTSAYGNNNEWEDMAEFARIHAQCLVEGTLDELEAASPERFRIWERILLNGTTIQP